MGQKKYKPLYEKVYTHFKELIERGNLVAGTRMPSLRYWAEVNGISKMTVEKAYNQLAAEGYIKAHERAPYEVVALPLPMKEIKNEHAHHVKKYQNEPECLYNFGTANMSAEAFDMSLWKRMLGYVLREPEKLLVRGSYFGEMELRKALANYVSTSRGVRTTAEQIIVGAGSQTLLQMIASLLRQSFQKIGFVEPFYKEGELIFEDYGFETVRFSNKSEALINKLGTLKTEVLYCTPSHTNHIGEVMPIRERMLLLEWAQTHQTYLIEDDYDSELRYEGRPMMALQGLDKYDRTIYIGSISKVLPPSIRLSYMVLPWEILEKYEKNYHGYGPTVSVLEQLALAEFMNRGEWQKQVRRLRKYYSEKSAYFITLLMEHFGKNVIIERPLSGVYVPVYIQKRKDGKDLKQLAKQHHCAVRECDSPYKNYEGFLLSFSGIAVKDLPKAVQTLTQAWKGEI